MLPYTVLSLPICTLVLISFFQTIPLHLENAAMIDGCSRVGALVRISVPLSAPGACAGLLAFVNSRGECLMALSFNSARRMRTLPLGITLHQGEFAFSWPVIRRARGRHRVAGGAHRAISSHRLTAGGVKG